MVVQNGVTQVSLVHSSDSVRTMEQFSGAAPTPSTSAFPFAAPSINNRMSKPPVRIVAQPPTMSATLGRTHVAPIPTMPVQPMAGRSNDEYSSRIPRHHPNSQHIGFTRSGFSACLTNEEHQKREALAQRTQEAMQRVRIVKRQVADEESELRRLRELERETNALREKNGGREKELSRESSRLADEQTALRTAALRVQGLTRQLEEMYRRRQTAAAAALVEHRKMQQQQNLNRSLEVSSFATSRATPPQEIVRPRASVEPFQVVPHARNAEVDLVKTIDFIDGVCAEMDTKGGLPIPSEPAYAAPSPKNSLTVVQQRDDVSPSPPKDPHPSQPTLNGAGSPPSCQPTTTTTTTRPAAELVGEPLQLYRDAMAEEANELRVERPTSISFADSLDESRLRTGKTDLVSLRSDSLKATKRRSWAASEGTSMTEAETIHRLLEEQRRGRNHFIPQLPTPTEEPSLAEAKATHDESAGGDGDDVGRPELKMTALATVDEESSSARSDDEPVEMEVTQSRRVKGILRPPNEKRNKGRIEFDPLALLLDAALEGELDLVKSSAAKLHDVSMANDEGITALHNAICAGHYEIVKFLIENDADVNAQDSDGWTPLHCAASCNNLPMVRQLVEGGGCVLASTLSDMETPVEKCEEEEDGYDGCLRYLVAAHNATGTLNNAKVYAAYPYEAQLDDELSFEAGDELVVVAKDDVDKHWWSCTNEAGRTGLVPRTYVALYPALKFRKRLNFVMFDLPLEANNNVDDDK